MEFGIFWGGKSRDLGYFGGKKTGFGIFWGEKAGIWDSFWEFGSFCPRGGAGGAAPPQGWDSRWEMSQKSRTRRENGKKPRERRCLSGKMREFPQWEEKPKSRNLNGNKAEFGGPERRFPQRFPGFSFGGFAGKKGNFGGSGRDFWGKNPGILCQPRGFEPGALRVNFSGKKPQNSEEIGIFFQQDPPRPNSRGFIQAWSRFLVFFPGAAGTGQGRGRKSKIFPRNGAHPGPFQRQNPAGIGLGGSGAFGVFYGLKIPIFSWKSCF